MFNTNNDKTWWPKSISKWKSSKSRLLKLPEYYSSTALCMLTKSFISWLVTKMLMLVTDI